MGAYVDPTALTGLFYEVYGDDVIDLVPESAKILKKVPFAPSEKQEGNKYHQPVILSYEQGVTYAAADAGAFALNASVALQMADAQIQGSQLLLRSAISYDAAARAATNKKAFRRTTELVVENMLESITKRLELSYLYGQTELTLCATSANDSTTQTTITCTLASWAAGMWAGMESASLDCYQTNGTTLVNSNAALTIDIIDLTARTIQVTGNSTDIAAVDSYIAGAGAGITKLRFYGAGGASPAEMAGIDKIVTNTGTLFNISSSTYALWAANSYAVGSAPLSFGKVLAGLVAANNKGLMEEVCLYCNPKTWVDMADDLAALRVQDSSYKTKNSEIGSESLTYYYMGGKITVEPHLFIKEGEAFALPMKRVKRLGAQDVSFKTPGRGEDIFTQLQDRAGYELRVYTDQCAFIERPAWCVKYTGIVNTA